MAPKPTLNRADSTGENDTTPLAASQARPSGAPSSLPPRPTGGVAMGLLKTIRPHQWVKNLFVLAPIVFARNAFNPALQLRALGAVAVFCMLSGAVYTLNDLVDVEADRVHKEKRKRPIASGQVPEAMARVFLVVLLVGSLSASLFFGKRFLVVAASYVTMNIAYSLRLKKIPFLDVLCIATGFVLRVMGGGYAIGVRVSMYMFACTFLLALFLGLGKRRHEIGQANAGKQRKALEGYTEQGLNVGLAVTGIATLATYVAYTLSSSARAMFQTEDLWMTSPSVVIGVTRFVQIVRGPTKSESPTQEMLRDMLFVVNLFVWAIVVVVIVYRIRPTATP